MFVEVPTLDDDKMPAGDVLVNLDLVTTIEPCLYYDYKKDHNPATEGVRLVYLDDVKRHSELIAMSYDRFCALLREKGLVI